MKWNCFIYNAFGILVKDFKIEEYTINISTSAARKVNSINDAYGIVQREIRIKNSLTKDKTELGFTPNDKIQLLDIYQLSENKYIIPVILYQDNSGKKRKFIPLRIDNYKDIVKINNILLKPELQNAIYELKEFVLDKILNQNLDYYWEFENNWLILIPKELKIIDRVGIFNGWDDWERLKIGISEKKHIDIKLENNYVYVIKDELKDEYKIDINKSFRIIDIMERKN